MRALPDHQLLDRVVRGRTWIALLGLMLAGIVAMQVEVLKLGASVGRSINEGSALQSRNELLRASVAQLGDEQRIERIAAGMGMVMPPADAVTFLAPNARTNPARAVANIHAPDATTFLAALPPDATATGTNDQGATGTTATGTVTSTAATGTGTTATGTSPTTAVTETGPTGTATASPAATSPATTDQTTQSTGAAASGDPAAAGTTPTGGDTPAAGTSPAGGDPSPAATVPTSTPSDGGGTPIATGTPSN